MRRHTYFLYFACMILAALPISTLIGDEEQGQEPPVKLRVIHLNGNYQDHVVGDIKPLAILQGVPTAKSFVKLCQVLDDLVTDEAITGVLFDLSSPDLAMNWAQIAELQRRIKRLRKVGKKTFSWLHICDKRQYSIAAACERVFMAENTGLDFSSPALSMIYLRDALHSLGIDSDIVRAGDFKAAVEPFMRSEMSAALKAHYRNLLLSLNDILLDFISQQRGIVKGILRQLQEKRLLPTELALKHRLIDKTAKYGQIYQVIQDDIGKTVLWVSPKKKAKRRLSFFTFINQLFSSSGEQRKKSEDRIAVLHLNGTIVSGFSTGSDVIASRPTVKIINRLKKDEHIKGVVLRINSPGGDGFASEEIRQALLQLAARKPIFISMGSVAASGAYWISCLQKPIYAEATTITGSIGVFGLKLSFNGLLNRLDLKVERVQLDESASMFAMDRPWTEKEREQLQKLINESYTDFLQSVANSRKKTVKEIRAIAGGRIFSGQEAKRIGLVDKLGGLDTALIDLRTKIASENPLKVVHFPEQWSFIKQFESLFGGHGGKIVHQQGIFTKLLFTYLQKTGFDVDLYLHLIKESARQTFPSIWALSPYLLRVE